VPKKQKTVIAEAAMSASAGGNVGSGPRLSGKDIEAAMADAVAQAMAKGIVDSDEILKLKMAAREKVVAEHRKAVAAAGMKAKK
jgi:hypothetical protein